MPLKNGSLLEETEIQKDFQKRGYLILRDFFSISEVTDLKENLKKSLVGEEQERIGYVPHGIRVWFAKESPDYLKKFIYLASIKNNLESLFQSPVEFLSVKTVFKSALVKTPSPWHQDRAYWGGCTKISIWIALDDISRDNGCLKVLPGSHRQYLDHQFFESEKAFQNRLNLRDLDLRESRELPMTAGSLMMFSDLLVHSSLPNSSGRDRWSLISTYRSRNQIDSSETWKTSLPL